MYMMKEQYIEMNGRIAINPKYISRILWSQELKDRFDQLYKVSPMSLRSVAKASGTAFTFVQKLRKEDGFEADYSKVLSILTSMGYRENALFDCPKITSSLSED
ncbi:MAG: hypothetical protein KatS3mg087_0612 [Patescibacteria group bacterium]|nr:MAG: hypothetical protein KatS3mg087_0612 [Patescibacteria group bacterium]